MAEHETADRPLTGTEYFQRAIGNGHQPAVYDKRQATHVTVIKKVYDEALIRFPEAADVIAALVFFKAVDRNREDFLWFGDIEDGYIRQNFGGG